MNAVQEVQEAIKTYGRPLWVATVPKPVRDQVDPKQISEMLATAHTTPEFVTREDQYLSIQRWCKLNVFEEATVELLEEISGLSAPTVRKYIDAHMDVFKKLRRGVWEVRDAQADRAAAK